MQDHKQRPKDVFCPLMKERCIDGWTPSMGEDDNHVRPTCVRWRGVYTKDMRTMKEEVVMDCADAWLPDLIQQTAQEVFQGAVATEQARNHIAGQATSFRRMSDAFVALSRKSGVTADDVKQIQAEHAAEVKRLEQGGKNDGPT